MVLQTLRLIYLETEEACLELVERSFAELGFTIVINTNCKYNEFLIIQAEILEYAEGGF